MILKKLFHDYIAKIIKFIYNIHMKKIFSLLTTLFILSACSLPLPSNPTSNPTTSNPTTSNPTTSNPTTSSNSDPTTSNDNTSISEPTSIVEEIEYQFVINCSDGGTVTGTESGTYKSSTFIELTALASEGFKFIGYFKNEELVFEESYYTFELKENTTIDARFESIDNDGYYFLNYSHVFKTEDFPNTNGGTTKEINGLTWNYTSYTYSQNSTKGVQIGSKNRPQTTPFVLSAQLPEGVIFTSFILEVCVASAGLSTFEINCGETKLSKDFSSIDIEMFTYDELEIESSSVSFSFKASARALYIYSIGFGLKVPSDINLSLGADSDIVADPVTPGVNGVPQINYQPLSIDEYYIGVDTSAAGTTLVKSLRTLISDMTSTSYDDAKYMLQYIDENPAKPGYLYGMYDGDDILSEWLAGSTWNREHVWPCAKMALEDEVRPDASTRNHTSDLHNLRAACPTVNGYHSDKYYGSENTVNYMYPNVTSGISGKHNFTGDFRGDVARIMFYMYVRYDGLELSDNPTGNTTMGKLSLFIEWNELDPVDSFEQQRNNRIYAYQGNRNPFIDYPELINNIF